MEAVRIDDAGAPGRLAVWLTAAGWALGLAGFFVLTMTPGKVETAPTALGLLGCALALAAPRLARLRPRIRRARLQVEPGRVVLGRTVVRPDNLAGAVVVQHEPPVLALAVGKAAPLSVTFASAAHLEGACRELGVGPRGCGTLRFVAAPGPAARLLEIVRVCAAALLVVLAVSDAAPLLLVVALWPVVPVLLLLALILGRETPSLELGAAGLIERTRTRSRPLPYEEMELADEPLQRLLGARTAEDSLATATLRARVAAAQRKGYRDAPTGHW